jgi:hypothetical protein
VDQTQEVTLLKKGGYRGRNQTISDWQPQLLSTDRNASGTALHKASRTRPQRRFRSAKHTPHDRRQPGWPISETKNNNPETKKAALGGFFQTS